MAFAIILRVCVWPFFILRFCFHFVFVWAGRDQGAFSIFLVKLFCIVCFVLVCFCLGLDLSLCIVCLFLNLYKKCNCLFLCLCLPGFCFCRVKYKFSNTIIYTSYNTKIFYTQIQKIKRTVQNLIWFDIYFPQLPICIRMYVYVAVYACMSILFKSVCVCVCVLCISFALGHTHSEYAYPYNWHFWLLLFVVNGKNVCLKCLIYVHADREHFIAFVVPVHPSIRPSVRPFDSVCSLAQSSFDIRTASIHIRMYSYCR